MHLNPTAITDRSDERRPTADRRWLVAILLLALLAAMALKPAPVPASMIPRDVRPFPVLTSQDRLLVLAPHEDDEVLGAAGVLQQAVAAGSQICVAYATYGDHNVLAFLFYRKRPWLNSAINRRMGELRRAESIEAMSLLGISSNQLTFLGYPDNCLMQIWKRHWDDSPPYYTWITAADRVPYADAVAFNRSHKGNEILADLEKILREFRPTHIIVSHPRDGHPDHRALYCFLDAALLKADSGLLRPRIFAYPLHLADWPRPRGLNPRLSMPFPAELATTETWWVAPLTEREADLKGRAIGCFRSQLGLKSRWLLTFARSRELFTSVDPLPLNDRPQSVRKQIEEARPALSAANHPLP